MKKRLIFDLDFFRMNHKAFRAILLKIAIKNGLLVSDAALSIMFPMSSNRKIENASFDIYYLFSVYILSEKSTPANRNKINKILHHYNKKICDLFYKSSKCDLNHLCDSGNFLSLYLRHESISNYAFKIKNYNPNTFKTCLTSLDG